MILHPQDSHHLLLLRLNYFFIYQLKNFSCYHFSRIQYFFYLLKSQLNARIYFSKQTHLQCKVLLQIQQALHRKNKHAKGEMRLLKRTSSCQIFFLLLTRDCLNISKSKFLLYFKVFGCLGLLLYLDHNYMLQV